MGDEGVEYLAQGLEHNRTITKLHMHHCNIGDAGCEVLVRALRPSACIRELNLSHNRIRDAGCASIGTLMECSPSLERLLLKFNFCGDKVRSLWRGRSSLPAAASLSGLRASPQ